MIRFNASILLISAFLYSIFMSFNRIEWLYCLPIIFALYCEKEQIYSILKKLFLLNFFIVVIFIFLLMEDSFNNALTIYVRTNMIMLFNLTLFSSSSGYDVVRALNELRFPKQIVSGVFFTIKMIQTLTDEFKKIKQTLKLRGFKANTSLFSYETYGNIFGHLFVNSIKKAHALEKSFMLRGFHGKIYLLNRSTFSKMDFFLLFLVCMMYVKKVVA